MSKPLLTCYAVRDERGNYFRSGGKPFLGRDTSWVSSLEKARIYSRPGPARAVITSFAEDCPKGSVLELVELHVTQVVVHEEKDRVKDAINKKAIAAAKRELERVEEKGKKYQEEREKAKIKLENLMAGNKCGICFWRNEDGKCICGASEWDEVDEWEEACEHFEKEEGD